mmetsp:Transcript_102075/g.284165  ORF Transcript_102075/g.284165 Transcript_102075/m.284165 type:complete len:494 (+) Transcript_102075:63-1544(+)
MGAAASVGVAEAVKAASASDLRAALAQLDPPLRAKLLAALAASGNADTCIQLLDNAATTGRLELSPFDQMLYSPAKPIPMVWFYKETLDSDALLSALKLTLKAYPVFCGRYASPPTAVELNNAGVPVEIRMAHKSDIPVLEAVAHLPTSPEATSPCFFPLSDLENFLPAKEAPGCSDLPLLSVRITTFAAGGTAVGMLLQHGIGDADAEISFARNWSRVFRGLAMEPAPIHERCTVNQLAAGDLATGEKPTGFKVRVIPPGEQYVPEFMGVLPKVVGTQVCIVPLPARIVKEMKEAACVELPPDQYISTDDVVTARVWRGLCAIRCAQLGLAVDSAESTTCVRAWNFRHRTDPPLGAGYCGNGVSHVWTELTVRELLAMPLSAVARHLRVSLQAHKSETVAARAQWLQQTQQTGCTVKIAFDQHALTFNISSWGFDWEGVDFNAKPLCFDHGALVPFVAVIIPRSQGDGLNVHAIGPQESMEQFAGLMTQKGT